MNLNRDNWIVETILDLEQTLISRQYTNSARSLAQVRLQLIREIYEDADESDVYESSNVVHLFV